MRSLLVTLIVVLITGCARNDTRSQLQSETPLQLVDRCVIHNDEDDPGLYEALIPRGLEVLPELRKLYLGDDADLRDRAIDAMVVLSLNSTDVVVGGLRSDDPNVRNTALGLSHKQIDDPEMRSLWISTLLDLWRESHLEFDKRCVRTRISRKPEVRAALRADLLVPLVHELSRRDEAMAGIAIIVIGELAPLGDTDAIAAIRHERRQFIASVPEMHRQQKRSFIRICDVALHNLGDPETIERFNQELLRSEPAMQAELLEELAQRRSIHLHLPALRILIDDESVIETECDAGRSYRIWDRVISTLRVARLPGCPVFRHPDFRTLSADERMQAYRDRVRDWMDERLAKSLNAK